MKFYFVLYSINDEQIYVSLWKWNEFHWNEWEIAIVLNLVVQVISSPFNQARTNEAMYLNISIHFAALHRSLSLLDHLPGSFADKNSILILHHLEFKVACVRERFKEAFYLQKLSIEVKFVFLQWDFWPLFDKSLDLATTAIIRLLNIPSMGSNCVTYFDGDMLSSFAAGCCLSW